MLLAVHISANVLSAPCLLLGFAGLVVLLAVGLYRMREEEIARVGLMTAALFVASSIHIPLWPITTVHLLLNGLAGVILGRRAAVAIPTGLLLQAGLLGHGDLTTLGVNACVMSLPALLARPLFHTVLASERLRVGEALVAMACLMEPRSVLIAAPALVAVRRLYDRVRKSGAFAAGFVAAATSVFLTSVLHSLVLGFGGNADWSVVAVLSLLAHLPVALVEGAILGTAADLIMRVRPSLLLPSATATRAVSVPPAALPTAPAPR